VLQNTDELKRLADQVGGKKGGEAAGEAVQS
jgi:hypothetical protein